MAVLQRRDILTDSDSFDPCSIVESAANRPQAKGPFKPTSLATRRNCRPKVKVWHIVHPQTTANFHSPSDVNTLSDGHGSPANFDTTVLIRTLPCIPHRAQSSNDCEQWCLVVLSRRPEDASRCSRPSTSPRCTWRMPPIPRILTFAWCCAMTLSFL